jgi:hypothetical protein
VTILVAPSTATRTGCISRNCDLHADSVVWPCYALGRGFTKPATTACGRGSARGERQATSG